MKRVPLLEKLQFDQPFIGGQAGILDARYWVLEDG